MTATAATNANKTRPRTATRAPDPRPTLSLAEHLALLHTYYAGPDAEPQLWARDEWRWAELAACTLSRLDGADPVAMRDAVGILAHLGLLNMDGLAESAADGEQGKRSMLAAEVLTRQGLEPATAQEGVQLLAAMASRLRADWGARLDALVIRHIDALANDVVRLAAGGPLTADQVHQAAVVWLQNTLNAPVSSSPSAVVRLRRRFRATPEDLRRAADEAGLGMAAVDHLSTAAEGDEQFEAWLAAEIADRRAAPRSSAAARPR